MRSLIISSLSLALAVAIPAMTQEPGIQDRGNPGLTAFGGASGLPVEKIGNDDLVGITVYDSPELTRPVRVSSDGDIRLPMLHQHIHAAGLYPADLEAAIIKELVDENVLADPIVTVSVLEYRSRPITVVGAVKNPLTFQATGTVHLLDAISRAGGLTENAGAEILVNHQQPSGAEKAGTLIQRVSVRALLAGDDPELNLKLDGGEEVRVPEAGRVFIVGNVKHPGAFYITDGSQSSVLKALALSQGLDNYSGHVAYIYRTEGGAAGKSEIPIELKKILDRKSPDVPLVANDILYVPNATGMRASLKVLETSLAIGTGLGAAMIYAFH